MTYELFLFDLDDTLLDFQESERLSFRLCLQSMGVATLPSGIYEDYQSVNSQLWRLFEQGQTTKDHLKVERFRKIFQMHQLELDPQLASSTYLEILPETVVLIDYAEEICQWLSLRGEIGIITNGISQVQTQRIKKSKLAPYISFTVVSEDCGFAKPDVRFFENIPKKARNFSKASSLVVGDRTEADILGAYNFGVDSCWFNPSKSTYRSELGPRAQFEISHLSELQGIIEGDS